MYMNGTLRSWIHYIDLRSGHGTQKEHMEVARACADAKPIYPMILDLLIHDSFDTILSWFRSLHENQVYCRRSSKDT